MRFGGYVGVGAVGNFAVGGPSGGSNIKSYQCGTATIDTGNTTEDVTITGVDLAKAVIKISYYFGNSKINENAVTAVFNSSTSIRFATASAVTAPAGILVNWEVIEYNNVKSLQSGLKSITGDGNPEHITNLTITGVNTSKTEVITSYRSSSTSTSSVVKNNYRWQLTSATNLRFIDFIGTATFTVAYFIIEFE